VLTYKQLIPAMERALSDFSTGRVIQPLRDVIEIEEEKRFLGIMPALGHVRSEQSAAIQEGRPRWRLPASAIGRDSAGKFLPSRRQNFCMATTSVVGLHSPKRFLE